MNRKLLETTLKGLLFTAKEKQCVLGENAKEDIKMIKDIYEEIIRFWELDEELTDEFEREIRAD
ncbi:hypothetical protein IRP63_08810 [Clostridium botulinum]|uniref:Uncharacterized protein n=1 Tax=Clostridium botulinum C/D str. DC5 TaxID=1443128 RepID=A0A0A0IH24_CLOBO|nr:hypothetical protein [Clostridium botulinum]KGM99571.1 hypothetical protein Z955_07040 [Clostridium botulinum C/D str. DC5]KOC52481.1 hypothetical protein ADU89_11265 [Clostridium botulinum]KOC56469.1 hypothetical protein ADU90_08155 [Clostridium botulinum]MCD3234363.1 hypothetical protein [Clostridium botulinum D/C]MCD3240187.1 hypothetical protein [Clostridium botulinum D/C]